MAGQANEPHGEVYATAAQEHMDAAVGLHETGSYVLSHYVAGLAVECLLRAFKSKIARTFDEHHDLDRLAKNARFYRRIESSKESRAVAAMGVLARRWDNSHRYRSTEALRRFLVKRGLIAKKGDIVKISSRDIVDAAIELITVGAGRWQS